MTTAEAAALMAAGAFLALTVVLTIVCVWTIVRLRREASALRITRIETEAMLEQLKAAAVEATLAAGTLAERARQSAAGTKLAYEALSGPVVKSLALASGVGQAARSLRKG